MKERIGMHFCMTYIYLVFVRNFLGDGRMYGDFNDLFQLSLVYSLILAVSITIIIEMWKMVIEVIPPKYFGYIVFLCPLLSMFLISFLHSAYYTTIIVYLAYFITKDSLDVFYMNQISTK